ncbi:hypothetical protein JR316_0005773 [Psilocybe cubensis]|uniref:Uncharacterized protein n=2 Tax=Psilocybe cubensis TaxID=181762 RepID=A0A8H8CMG5_PSICU|nr:hypothetical protein JR316_0005773 [Psilocybe cubensis]KAH9481251.1 hypothetical protein JR316_0005773 [Psilocybe cubensis]
MAVAPRPVFFPSPGLQVMTALIYFLGLTTITHCISRRLQHENLSIQGIRSMPWPRMAVVLMYLDSWLFILGSAILTFGLGLEHSEAICITAAYLCVVFYSTAKFFVYAFLAEKAHIVWSPTKGERRLESSVYLCCLVSVSLYCIVMTLMLGGPIYETKENGQCVIGLKPRASIPLLVYDLYINLFLTFMFLYPLIGAKVKSSAIRRLAVRTGIAGIVALSTSTVNVAVLIHLDGREMGWVNLSICSADIIINAAAIFWVSGSKASQQQSTSSGLPPEQRHRGRHLNNHVHHGENPTFSTGNNPDSVHFSPGLKTTLSNAPPVLHDSDTTGSFPGYHNGDIENGRPGHFPKTNTSWVGRLFTREKQPNERHLKIAVTREYDTQTSQIELQARPDSNSEVLDEYSKVSP